MIDLHSHILPALDDGALDIEDSIAMARVAVADGIEAVCATPHIRADHAVDPRELIGRVEQLGGDLARAGVGLRLLTGGEVAQPLAPDLSDEELRLVSLGGGGTWVLLEPAAGPVAPPLERAVERLGERGFRCVIAHPERHAGDGFEAALARLTGLGALMQITAEWLLDPRTEPWILELARRGLVHVLASDAHSSRHGRPLRLAAALERLSEARPDAAELNWIAEEAPAAIVAGRPVTPPFDAAG